MSNDTALVVIDAQVGLLRDAYNKDEVLQRIASLLEQARASATPVIYVQHNEPGGELEPHTPDWQIHPAIEPREGEPVVQKTAPDAFYQTSFQEELAAGGIKRLVITGMQTEYCVAATARRAVTQGFDVLLVSDAHTTFDSKTLTAEQIIAFYNTSSHGFWAGDHVIRVKPASDILF